MALKYLFIFCILFLINCTNEDDFDLDSENEKPIISMTSEELINRINLDEQKTLDEFKQCYIQITDVIIEIGRPKDYIPISDASYIVFGDGKKNGWDICAYFDEFIVADLRTGDVITIQGYLTTVERSPDFMYVDLKRCRIVSISTGETEVPGTISQ